MTEPNEDKMPLTSHLEELRKRLVRSLAAVGIAFMACFFFKEELSRIVAQPLISVLPPGTHMVYTGLPEAFFTYIKVSFYAGIFLASPVVLYHAEPWTTFHPGPSSRPQRQSLRVMGHIINKQRNILEFALSSLLRRKWKNLALVSVYTLVVFSLASVMYFAHVLKKESSLVLSATPELIVQKMMAGRHDLIPLSYAEKIREIRGVAAMDGRLWGYYYDPLVRANYTLLVNEKYALPEKTIAVGAGIARVRSAFRGSSMGFFSYDGKPMLFQVQGVLSPESELLSSDLILLSRVDFRRLFGIPDDLEGGVAEHEVGHERDVALPERLAGPILQHRPPPSCG